MQMSYLYASDSPFKNVCKIAQNTKTIRKNVWEETNDAYSLLSTDNNKPYFDLYVFSGATAAEARQAEPHTHIRELKGTHELIFSCVPWLAVLLVGAYARRRRRRRRWSRATWRPYSNNRLTETCSLGLPCISLISDIHVMIN